MSAKSSWQLYNSIIEQGAEEGTYRARQLTTSGCFMAADATGTPTFLVPLPKEEHGRFIPSIHLTGIQVDFGSLCRFSEQGDVLREGRFVVVQCLAIDPVVRRCFIQLLAPAVEGLGEKPSSADIRSFVDAATTLFTPSEDSGEDIRGLWGELCLISIANDPDGAVAAWRTRDRQRFDFSEDNDRLEVKTALGSRRAHTFSLEQLRPRDGVTVVVASILLQDIPGGVGIAELVDKVSGRLSSASYNALLRRCNSTLIGASRTALEEEFDLTGAKASMRFYDAATIPSVDPNVPPSISRVKFELDLSGFAGLKEPPIQRPLFDRFK